MYRMKTKVIDRKPFKVFGEPGLICFLKNFKLKLLFFYKTFTQRGNNMLYSINLHFLNNCVTNFHNFYS